MKQHKRRIAVALALIMLLTPALAYAAIDIDIGSVTIGATEYSQDGGAVNEPYTGTVSITSTSGTTDHTITLDTSAGAVSAAVTGVTFTGSTDPNEAAITIEGSGTASLDLNGVAVEGANSAIAVDGGTANIGMTDVDISIGATGSMGPAISVRDSTVTIDVNGTNTVEQTSGGAALTTYNATVTVAGDSAGDTLELTSESPGGTVAGDGTTSTLAVSGTATVQVENTAGAEPVQNTEVRGTKAATAAGGVKTLVITAPSEGEGASGQDDSNLTEEQKTVQQLFNSLLGAILPPDPYPFAYFKLNTKHKAITFFAEDEGRRSIIISKDFDLVAFFTALYDAGGTFFTTIFGSLKVQDLQWQAALSAGAFFENATLYLKVGLVESVTLMEYYPFPDDHSKIGRLLLSLDSDGNYVFTASMG